MLKDASVREPPLKQELEQRKAPKLHNAEV